MVRPLSLLAVMLLIAAKLPLTDKQLLRRAVDGNIALILH